MLELFPPPEQYGRLFAKKSRSSHKKTRRPFTQTAELEDRLQDRSKQLRDRAAQLEPGPAREALVRQAVMAEKGAQMSEWLRSQRRGRVSF